MKRSWLLSAALLAMITGPAFAADMPLKAPPAPVPVAAGWNGFYTGIEVGEKWSKADWDPTCITQPGIACGSAVDLALFPGFPDSGRQSFNKSGTRVGIYTGWMFTAYNSWVFGAESDYAFASRNSTVGFIPGCVTAACTGGFATPPFSGDSVTLHLGDDYSFRLRAGFLVLPELQLYATGGAAAQKVSATVTCGAAGAAGCIAPGATGFNETTLVGWTAGGGLEWKVWDHILLRGEYRFNDYGTWKQNITLGNQLQEFANVRVKSQMATVGIAWLFPPPRW